MSDHRSTEKGWRDIASAPKDGTCILLLSKQYVEPGNVNSDGQPIDHPARCAIGRWHAEGDSWCDDYGRFPDDPLVDDDTINLHVTGVWFSGGGWFQPNEVTHWQPLPSPPAHQENSPRSGGEADIDALTGTADDQGLFSQLDPEPAPQVRQALEDLLVVVSTEAKRTAGFLSKATWQPRRESIEGQVKLLDYIADKLLAALTPVVAREPVGWRTVDRRKAYTGMVTADPKVRDVWLEAGIKFETLYTSPPPASAVREATIEECAKIAEKYSDIPCSSPHNNTLEAFQHGMNHMAGCVDSATCIEEAIRALSIKGTDLKQADETSKQKLTDPSC